MFYLIPYIQMLSFQHVIKINNYCNIFHSCFHTKSLKLAVNFALLG